MIYTYFIVFPINQAGCPPHVIPKQLLVIPVFPTAKLIRQTGICWNMWSVSRIVDHDIACLQCFQVYASNNLRSGEKPPSWSGSSAKRTIQHGFNDLISQHWMLILEEVLHLISCPAPYGFGPQLKGASCTRKWRQARDQFGMPRSGRRHGGWGSDSGVVNGEYMWRVHRNAKGVWNYSSTLGWSCCVLLRDNFLCPEVWSRWRYLGTYPCHLSILDVSLSRISVYDFACMFCSLKHGATHS